MYEYMYAVADKWYGIIQKAKVTKVERPERKYGIRQGECLVRRCVKKTFEFRTDEIKIEFDVSNLLSSYKNFMVLSIDEMKVLLFWFKGSKIRLGKLLTEAVRQVNVKGAFSSDEKARTEEMKKNEEVCKLLIESGADLYLNFLGFFTPWGVIYKMGSEEIKKLVDAILFRDMEVFATYPDGYKQIIRASEIGNIDKVKHILERSLSVDYIVVDVEDYECKYRGHTALNLAVRNKHYEIVDMLREHGADPNNLMVIRELDEIARIMASYKEEELTNLMFACKEHDLKLVNALLKFKDIDLNKKNNEGKTALIYACKLKNSDNRYEIMKALVDAGASVDAMTIRALYGTEKNRVLEEMLYAKLSEQEKDKLIRLG